MAAREGEQVEAGEWKSVSLKQQKAKATFWLPLSYYLLIFRTT